MKRLAIGSHIVDWVAEKIGGVGCFGTSARGIGLQHRRVEYDDGGSRWRTIAGVVYEDWNGPNVVCHIAAEGANWLNREYLWTIFDYPYNKLGVTRITAPVGEGNAASRRFVERLGFELEARLCGAHRSGDLLIYRLGKPECRWLGIRRTEHEKLAA